jgi:hypothetical protein
MEQHESEQLRRIYVAISAGRRYPNWAGKT